MKMTCKQQLCTMHTASQPFDDGMLQVSSFVVVEVTINTSAAYLPCQEHSSYLKSNLR